MCTNFKVKRARDGSVVVGRSMEFPMEIPTALGVLPIGFRGKAAVPHGQSESKEWTGLYGVLGMSAYGNPQMLTDGMNTEGVSAHALYMPNHSCDYQTFKGDGTDVAELDVIAFLLGTCANIAEVKQAVRTINIWGNDPGLGFTPPLHFLVHDAASSISIEFHVDEVRIVDNPTGVGTNAPYLEWHLVNLNNYVGLSATVPAEIDVVGAHLAPFGQGQGTMGMPGDYTGPSRFVRAFTMVALADQPEDSQAAEQLCLHILNSFDIPPGLIKEEGPGGDLVDEVTVWVTISNLSAKRYSYRTFGDPTVFVVDLNDVDFTIPARSVPMSWEGQFIPTRA